MTKKLKKYSIYLILLLSGALLGFFFDQISKITFDEKVSPVALASLVLTVIIALYLEFIVRPTLSNSRNEKDIIIEQLKGIRDSCSDVHSCYNKIQLTTPIPKEEKAGLIFQFRILSNHIEVLNDIVEYSKTKNIKSNCTALFKQYLKYKKSLTGYNFDKPAFFYERIYFSKHDISFNALNKEIMHLIFDVNKL